MREYSLKITDFDGSTLTATADSDSPLDISITIDEDGTVTTIYLNEDDTRALSKLISSLQYEAFAAEMEADLLDEEEEESEDEEEEEEEE